MRWQTDRQCVNIGFCYIFQFHQQVWNSYAYSSCKWGVESEVSVLFAVWTFSNIGVPERSTSQFREICIIILRWKFITVHEQFKKIFPNYTVGITVRGVASYFEFVGSANKLRTECMMVLDEFGGMLPQENFES